MKDPHKSRLLLLGERDLLTEAFPVKSSPGSKGYQQVDLRMACGLERAIRRAGRRFLCGACRQWAWWIIFLFQVAAVATTWAETQPPVPTLQTIISRMAQARQENRARFRPYLVTRDYNFFGKERGKSKSQVLADVSFVPPNSKKYTIQQTRGSGLGERVVRRMLESEMEIAKHYGATDISADNYGFRFDGEEAISGQPCYRLELLPKRKDRNLLHARIWVDAGTYAIRRMEGEPAKSLSWWLRNVRITFLFGDVGGMWLQTASESTVNVRILGRYTMVSSDIKYRLDERMAVGLPFNQGAKSNDGRIALTLKDPSNGE